MPDLIAWKHTPRHDRRLLPVSASCCCWLQSYSGSSDHDEASGVLNFALEGDAAQLAAMCRCLDSTAGIRRRAVGCELPEAAAPLIRRI